MPGANLCIAKLAITQKQFGTLGRKGIKDWTTQVLAASKEMCPVDTGKLRRSGTNFILKNTLTEFYMRISYTMNYAAAVHEIPAAHPVGSMKYLATPFNLMSYLLIKKLESGMRKAV